MTTFEVLFNFLIGILGGIISSIIVSRVFLIQGEFQQQLRFIEQIIRKLGMLSAYFQAVKIVFEVDYDGELEMQHEMQQKGYKTEEDYYAANKDKDWISKNALLNTFLVEMKKIVREVKEEICNTRIDDGQLTEILILIMDYLSKIDKVKEFSFSQLHNFQKQKDEIVSQYETYQRESGKQLTKLILKDKTMIVLYVLVGVMIVCTIVTYCIGI